MLFLRWTFFLFKLETHFKISWNELHQIVKQELFTRYSKLFLAFQQTFGKYLCYYVTAVDVSYSICCLLLDFIQINWLLYSWFFEIHKTFHLVEWIGSKLIYLCMYVCRLMSHHSVLQYFMLTAPCECVTIIHWKNYLSWGSICDVWFCNDHSMHVNHCIMQLSSDNEHPCVSTFRPCFCVSRSFLQWKRMLRLYIFLHASFCMPELIFGKPKIQAWVKLCWPNSAA